MLKNELADYWDELVIRTKAGCGMWRGPCGDDGSHKCLLAIWVLRDQNLQGLDRWEFSAEELEDIDHIVMSSNEEG